MSLSELEKLRLIRAGRDESQVDRQTANGLPFVGRVTTATPAVDKFVNVIPQILLGDEVENGTASWADAGSTPVPVLLLGPGVPATGDRVLARSVGHRWVARRKAAGGGGGTGSLGLCCDPSPGTITLAVVGGFAGVIEDCTLVYGATPPGLAPYLPANTYLSTTTFFDAFGEEYRYYLSCSGSALNLIHVYESSIFGAPYGGVGQVYTWTTGVPNTCSPFSYTLGSPPPGQSWTATLSG